MSLTIKFKVIKQIKSCEGFTLIEALLSVALLVLVAAAISSNYITGLTTMDEQAERMLLDSHLRSQMEVLVNTDFGSLSSGSDNATIRGKNYTITWTVVNVDLDGDLTPEPNAVQVTVSVNELPNASLTTIIYNNEGKVGKIS